MDAAVLPASRLLARLKAWIAPAASAAAPPAEPLREPFPKYYVHAWCDPWPDKQEMLRILAAHGLQTHERAYAVEAVIDGRAFAFEVYGGDIGEPEAEASDHDLSRLTDHAAQVSAALAAAGVRHRLEILEHPEGEPVASVHHRMPRSPDDASAAGDDA